MKNGFVPIGDTRMYYARFGRGARALVVLPGLSDGLATVRGKALLLAAPYLRHLGEYTVYMFSRKERMPAGYSIRDMAEDQAAALRALGVERAAVLGVSQGGMIAQLLAAGHPETVERLVLAVTAPYANDTVTRAVRGWIDMAGRGDHASLMADTAEKTYSAAYLEKNRRFLGLAAKLSKPRSYDRFFINARAILNFDARGELEKIACPTLIIAGGEDKTVGGDAARELSQGIAGSRLFVYEGLGHGAYEEGRDFYDRVFEFLGARD